MNKEGNAVTVHGESLEVRHRGHEGGNLSRRRVNNETEHEQGKNRLKVNKTNRMTNHMGNER